MQHKTVLLQSAVDALNLKKDSVVIDCTFGSGGHANEILSRLGKSGTYIGIDADESAFIDKREQIETHVATTHLLVANFREIADIVSQLEIEKADAILADLGWRTEQFAKGDKGFSFNDDSALLMTYGDPKAYTFTAHDIVNEWDEENIADIIFGYGEERGSRRIARAIVEAREIKPIEKATELALIVEDALPKLKRPSRIHPATKTFQALRIAVNDELGAVETLVKDGFNTLKPGGKMAIITFHSIEDRVVKKLFRSLEDNSLAERITKKPIVPTREEIIENPRARSAKLRIIQKN